jgi:hypothetical protein
MDLHGVCRPHLILPGLLLDRPFEDVLRAMSQYKEVWLFGKDFARL